MGSLREPPGPAGTVTSWALLRGIAPWHPALLHNAGSTELPAPAQGSEMGPAQKPEPLSPLNAGMSEQHNNSPALGWFAWRTPELLAAPRVPPDSTAGTVLFYE